MIELLALAAAIFMLVLIVDTAIGMYCAWHVARIESETKAIDEALATGYIDERLLRRIQRRQARRERRDRRKAWRKAS